MLDEADGWIYLAYRFSISEDGKIMRHIISYDTLEGYDPLSKEMMDMAAYKAPLIWDGFKRESIDIDYSPYSPTAVRLIIVDREMT